jgi:hypothetical protein
MIKLLWEEQEHSKRSIENKEEFIQNRQPMDYNNNQQVRSITTQHNSQSTENILWDTLCSDGSKTMRTEDIQETAQQITSFIRNLPRAHFEVTPQAQASASQRQDVSRDLQADRSDREPRRQNTPMSMQVHKDRKRPGK